MEMEKAKEAAEKEQYRMEVAASLSPEPTTQGDDITIIRFRLPKGKQLERKFLVGTPLKALEPPASSNLDSLGLLFRCCSTTWWWRGTPCRNTK